MNFNINLVFLLTFFTISVFCTSCEGNFLENVLINLRDDHQSNRGLHDIDPFPINRVFDWDLPKLKLHLSLDTYIAGFMNYDIHQSKITPDLKMTLNTTLGEITFGGFYSMNGTYYKIVPLNGDGDIFIQLKKFTFYTEVQIAPNNGTVKILSYDMDFNYDDFKISISGLTGVSDVGEVIKQFVKDLFPNALRKKREQIIPLIKKLTMTEGNDYLKNANLNTLIEMLKYLLVY